MCNKSIGSLKTELIRNQIYIRGTAAGTSARRHLIDRVLDYSQHSAFSDYRQQPAGIPASCSVAAAMISAQSRFYEVAYSGSNE